MQIENTKERHSTSDGKAGFLKKLVNSTTLGFIDQNKILQVFYALFMVTLKSQYFKLNYWTSQTCCFVKSSPNIYKIFSKYLQKHILASEIFRTRFSPIYVSKDLYFILLLNHSLGSVCHHNCVELYRASASFLLPSEDSKQRVYDNFSPASKSLPEYEKHIREPILE